MRGAMLRCCAATVLLLLCFVAGAEEAQTEFYALIDAGSSGTRVYVFAWQAQDVLGSFHEVAHKRMQPGLSSMLSSPAQLADQLSRLCDFAESHIPAGKHKQTQLAIMATAGLRLLPKDQQESIMTQALEALDGRCDFDLQRTVSGVISGEQEAVYDWVATNTIFGTLGGEHIAAIDLGSASTQIAVPISRQPDAQPMQPSCSSATISLPNAGTVDVYATSLLGFGLLSAMHHVLGHPTELGANPCLPQGSFPAGTLEDFDRDLEGTGSFDQCQAHIRSAFKPMLDSQLVRPCISTGSFSVMIAMDNYPKVVQLLHSNKTTPSLEDIESGGRKLCEMTWRDICDANPTVPDYRCQKACFGMAYVSFLLRDVYGLLSGPQAVPVEFRARHRSFEVNWPVGAIVHHLLHKVT